jgi:hypothetical protein
MSWPSIVFLIMSAMLWLAAASFITLILILRFSPGAGQMLGFLDSAKLKIIQRKTWWVLIPLAIALIAGTALIIYRINAVAFFLGVLLASVAVAGVPGFILIGEVARSTKLAKGT